VIDARTVVDAHVHVPRLATLKPAWFDWADHFSGPHDWRSAYDDDGDPVPAALDALLEAEGVDRALLFCEYSPRATGIQPIEDLLPIVAHNPVRFRLVANVNPYLHHPVAAEVERVFHHVGHQPRAHLALARDNVWLDLAGLPPRKLPEYYARFDLTRLAGKFVFGTDWPGVPGTRRNVRELAALGLPEDVLKGVLSAHAAKIFPRLDI
jgi:predicted TIM-barrel fold metal-dependent hydrolase